MSTALSAHNGCLELFRTCEPGIWRGGGIKEIKRQGGSNVHCNFPHSSARKQELRKRPNIHVEANDEDFIRLANYLKKPIKKIPTITHKTASFAAKKDMVINQPDDENEWLMLENLMEDDWGFVHVNKEPSYADIVSSNGFHTQESKKKEIKLQRKLCNRKKDIEEKVQDNDNDTISPDEMHLDFKYKTAEAYHRKIEIKRKKRRST